MRQSNDSFLKFASLIFTSALATTSSYACNSEQQIRMSVGATVIDEWTGTSDTIRAITLPNAFKLGVKIEETSREKYEEWMRRSKQESIPAYVRISLYDLTTPTPRLITRTWGGVNGKQGYSPKGGASRVDEVGSPGVIFALTKLNCADPSQKLEFNKETIATLPTTADLNQSNDQPQMSADNLRGSAAATADVATGNYRIAYPDAMLREMPARGKEVMQRLFKEAGIDFVAESSLFATENASFVKGYMVTMMRAIEAKFGRAKLKSIEAKMKAELGG